MVGVGRGVGRPSGFSVALGEEICLLIAGGASLRSVCGQSGMPSRGVVFEWLMREPEFARLYALARGLQADVLAEEVLDIADSVREPSDLAAAKLRIDARKWFAGKVSPRKYGEGRGGKEVVSDDGGGDEAVVVDVSGLSDATLRELVACMDAGGGHGQ